MLALAACSPNAAQPPQGAPPAPDPAADYLHPPTPREVSLSGGHPVLTGQGLPGSRVRLTAQPSGQETVAEVGADGVFRFNLARAPAPRLYSLTMEGTAPSGLSRRVAGEGFLLVTPDGRGVLLRPGAGAVALRAPTGRMAITTLDYDGAGGAVISGEARRREALTARVDGVTRGHDEANRQSGRFSIALEPLRPGAHEFVVAGQRSGATFRAAISDPAALTQGPFRAERTAFGWRIDWMTPGRGLQTTLIID